MERSRYVVYLVRCADGTYYTGITTDLERRLRMHNMGRGARYTAGRRPVRCVYCEQIAGRSAALRREYVIKQMTRTQKRIMIRGASSR